MALLTIQELEARYGLTAEQKERIREARTAKEINFEVTEEAASKITGYKSPLIEIDSRVGVVKYEEDDIKKLLGL